MFSVIFEVHPAEGKKDDYLGHAKDLKPELESIDGFIDNERFESRSRSGWVLSHSTWRDEKSVIRWRTQAKHHVIQEAGRSEIFSDYHLRVGEVTADTHPPEGVPIHEFRFDATEVGKSKVCTLFELTPLQGTEFTKDGGELLHLLGLDEARRGLNEAEIYDSIYNPGKVLVLGSWTELGQAEAFEPSDIADASMRRRTVRIIRDYSMFDRRETPQYYPEVKRHA